LDKGYNADAMLFRKLIFYARKLSDVLYVPPSPSLSTSPSDASQDRDDPRDWEPQNLPY